MKQQYGISRFKIFLASPRPYLTSNLSIFTFRCFTCNQWKQYTNWINKSTQKPYHIFCLIRRLKGQRLLSSTKFRFWCNRIIKIKINYLSVKQIAWFSFLINECWKGIKLICSHVQNVSFSGEQHHTTSRTGRRHKRQYIYAYADQFGMHAHTTTKL